MKNTTPPPFISEASDDRVVVRNVTSEDLRSALAGLGFSRTGEPDVLDIKVKDENQKALIFKNLRDRNLHFSRGREWSPAEVFEWLRDRGLLEGRFRSISWISPDRWITGEE